MRQAHFELYRDAGGAWRWRLRAANGRIVADSGEGYSTKRACVNARDRLVLIVTDANRGVDR